VTSKAEFGNAMACLLFLAAFPNRSFALDPNKPFSSYLQTHFTPDEGGLPSGIVDDIVQSRDGFLWFIVNSHSLVRFDGQHFIRFDEPANVRALAMAPNGDLWLGTADHLERIPAAALNQFGRLPGDSYPNPGGSGDIVCLHVSRDGALWVGTAVGLYRFADGSFSPIVEGSVIQRIEEASSSHILAATSAGFIEWDGSRTVEHPEIVAALDVKSDQVFQVLEDSHGVTWFCTLKGVARRVGSSIEKLSPYGPGGHGATRAYQDPQGNIWFFKVDGLYRAAAGGLELAFSAKNLRGIYGDVDGDLWVGTNGDGLYRFKDRAVRMFTKSEGLPDDVIMTVLATSDGGLWTGANCGGISRFDGKRFKTYNEKDGLLNSCVWSLAEDANRDLWIGTWGGGAFRFRDGHFTQFSKGQGLTSDIVRGLIAVRDGDIWLATDDGVTRIRNGQVRNYHTTEGLSSNHTVTPFEDSAGGIWIATYVGFDRLDGDRFVGRVSFPERGTFPIGEDEFGNLYVNVAPMAEVRRLHDGRLDPIAAYISATGMVETQQHELWLSGAGITRVASTALRQRPAQDEPLDYESFGVADGMATPQSTVGHPNSALTRDGRLWVATMQGLAMMDLPHLPRTARKPSIYVEEVTVGRNTQFPGHALVLPPGTHHVELQFDAIEISSPEKNRLQYRLDGVDSEWLDAPHPGRATFSNIPPGAHALHIRACNRFGIWDRAGMVYMITQLPYFYQTRIFEFGSGALLIMLLAGGYRFRLRQELARIKVRLEERVAERERIARDLHDTLLQSFQGSLFEVQAGRNLIPRRPDDAIQTLDEAIRSAEAAIAEGRDAIQDLRSGSAAPSDMAHLFAAAGQELSGVAASNGGIIPAFCVTVEGPPRDLETVLQDELYRIGREILRNAFRHACSNKIEVEIRYDAEELRLRFRDDGIGIDPKVLDEGARPGHWGLPGIRERAKAAGARVDFWSEVGVGTEVQVIVPASVAYAKSPEARVFGLFRKKSRSHGE
jgi:signal transduction histidine kinase/ligand-binding sensor domain-containing protein